MTQELNKGADSAITEPEVEKTEEQELTDEELNSLMEIDTEGEKENTEISFKDKVEKAIAQIQYSPLTGEYIVPKGMDENVAISAKTARENIELKREGVKNTLRIKKLKENHSLLLEEVSSNYIANLSVGQQEELKELKFSDPDLWRKKVNAYEKDAKNLAKKEFAKKYDTSLEISNEDAELSYRGYILAEYNKEHLDKPLTEEVVKNELPPRLLSELDSGKITFETFLAKAERYLGTGKKIVDKKVSKQPNLSKVSGASVPKNSSKKKIDIKDVVI